jgi:tripartite-type tricarboxylate transporter receptor subunit TctC
MVSRRQLLEQSAAAFCAAAGIAPVARAAIIAKAGRVIVGFPPGGAPDMVARLVADALKSSYAQTVIVENKPGAGGRIAAESVKSADADGSTMLVTPNPIITIYPHVYRKLAYDPLHDFVPVTSLCSYPLVLSAGPGLPPSVKSLADIVPWAKANPNSASFGTPAAGSTLHFIGLVLASAAGITLEHVPYRGPSDLVSDLVGGRIPLAVTPPAPVVPHIRAGRLRALAISSAARSSILPDVPTFKESGYPQLAVNDWIGLFVPAKTPADTVERLNGIVREALTSREVKDAYATLMMEPSSESAHDAARMVEAEYQMWRPIVKASGFVAAD